MLKNFIIAFLVTGVGMTLIPVDSISILGIIGLTLAFLWVSFWTLYLIEVVVFKVRRRFRRRVRGLR